MTLIRNIALLAVFALPVLRVEAAPFPAAKGGFEEPAVQFDVLADTTAIQPGRSFQILARFKVAPEHHLYYRDAGEIGLPVKVKFEPVPGLAFGEAAYPVPRKVVEPETGVSHYLEKTVGLLIPVTVAPDFAATGEVTLKAAAEWLDCTVGGNCVPGIANATLKLPIAAKGAEPAAVADEVQSAFRSAAGRLPKPADQAKHVKVSAALDKSVANAGDTVTATLTLEIDPGWHIQSHKPGGNYIATDVVLEIPPGFEKLEAKPGFNHRPTFPEGQEKDFPGLGGKVSLYEGKVVITTKLVADKDAKDLHPVLRGLVTFQACDDKKCLPPQTVAFDTGGGAGVPTNPPATGTKPPATGPATNAAGTTSPPAAGETEPVSLGGLALQLGIGLLAGLALNFMPCVLPVLGLKIISFVQQGGEEPGRAARLGLVFSAGLVLVFLVLGGITASVIAAGNNFGWGKQFGNPIFTLAITTIVFVFALSLFGVWTIRVPGAINDLGAKNVGEGYGAAFFKGMLTTVLATPCTGPGLGTLMAWALKQPPFLIMLVFASVGIGMASPYLILTANPKLMRFMPRPGAWMEKFERAMGFVLLASVVWFLYSLHGFYARFDETNLTTKGLYTNYAGDALLASLGFLTCLAAAVWTINTLGDENARTPRPMLGWTLGAVLTIGGYLLFFSYLAPTPRLDPFDAPVAGRTVLPDSDRRVLTEAEKYVGVPVAAAAGAKPSTVGAAKTLRDKVRALAAEGETVHVDFTAVWCLNCKGVKKFVLDPEDTRQLIKELGVISLVADWTDTGSEEGQQIDAWLKELNVVGIPVQVIYPAGKPNEPIVLAGVITKGAFHEALRKAGPSKPNGGAAAAANRAMPAEALPVAATAPSSRVGGPWERFTEAGLAAHLMSGKTVHLAVTADWDCSAWQPHPLIFATPEVMALKRELGVVSMEADWSETGSPYGRRIDEFLSRNRAVGIPISFIYPAGKSEPIILSGYMTKQAFLDALRKAGPSRDLN